MKERQKERDGENQRRRKSSAAGIEPTTSWSLDHTWPLCHNNCWCIISFTDLKQTRDWNKTRFSKFDFFLFERKEHFGMPPSEFGQKNQKSGSNRSKKVIFFKTGWPRKKEMEQKMSKPEFEIKSERKNLVRFVSDAIFSSFSDSILAFNQSSGPWVFKESKFELC